MEEMTTAVESLYHFRDHFFEQHPLSEAAKKSERIEEQLQMCLRQLDHMQVDEGDPAARAEVLRLRGRALNIRQEHCPEAERLLSRAVKLAPSLVEAWNELGECYWKRSDVENARICFEGALAHRCNKISLRNLSMVMRLKSAASSEERLRNIEQGLTKAREAVQLDTTDGISWSILGNAYLMHFFTVSQNPRTLKQAMSAYKQAEKDVIASSSSELYYNKGVTLKYEEEYPLALESFDRASALDPTWEKPNKQRTALVQSLTDIKNLIELKGKLKTKRFNSLVGSVNPKSLGPFGGGKYSSPTTGASVTLTEVNFKDLKEGMNEEKVVLGKVICSVHSEDSVPFTFCLTDRSGHCLAVNLYNLAPGKGVIIGDSVAIADPYFTTVKVERESKVIEFELIRVDSPLALVINGKRASQDLQAGIELSTFTKSD